MIESDWGQRSEREKCVSRRCGTTRGQCCSILGILLSWKESLNCRGWPTSLILLLSVEVSKFAFALGGHAPLGLHHLLGIVGAARRLVVSLLGVKVLEIGARRAARLVKVVDGVGSGALAVGGAACCDKR